jgi:hypothetical protein
MPAPSILRAVAGGPKAGLAAAPVVPRFASSRSAPPATAGRRPPTLADTRSARTVARSGAASASWARARSPSRSPGAEPPLWDVVGLGEALVDCCAPVPDGLLAEFGVEKGGRR